MERRAALLLTLIALPASGLADTPEYTANDVVWIAIAAALVFLMQAGFALLESGLSRTKNAINVVMKNYMDLCVGTLMFCEDSARRLKRALDNQPCYQDFWLRVNHLESLHAHNAVAIATKEVEGGYLPIP